MTFLAIVLAIWVLVAKMLEHPISIVILIGCIGCFVLGATGKLAGGQAWIIMTIGIPVTWIIGVVTGHMIPLVVLILFWSLYVLGGIKI